MKQIKGTGIVRKLDKLGRFTIPTEIREMFGYMTGMPLEFHVGEGKLKLRLYKPGCILCKNTEQVKVYAGQKICKNCAKSLAIIHRI